MSKRKKEIEIDDDDENENSDRSRSQRQPVQKVYDFHKKTIEVYPERLRELNRQFAASISSQLTSEPYSVLVGNCLDYVRQYFTYEDDLLQYSPWLANRLKQSKSDIVNCLQNTIDLYEALARHDFDYLLEKSSSNANGSGSISKPKETSMPTYNFPDKSNTQFDSAPPATSSTRSTSSISFTPQASTSISSSANSTAKNTVDTASVNSASKTKTTGPTLPTAGFTFESSKPTTSTVVTTGFVFSGSSLTATTSSSSSTTTTTTTAAATTPSSSTTTPTTTTAASSSISGTPKSTTTTSSVTSQPITSGIVLPTPSTTTTTPAFGLSTSFVFTAPKLSGASSDTATPFGGFSFNPGGNDSPAKLATPPFGFNLPVTTFGTSTFSSDKTTSSFQPTSGTFSFNPATPSTIAPAAAGDEDDEPSEPPAAEKVVHEADAKLTYNCRMGVKKGGNLTKRGPVQVVIKSCNDKNQMIVRSDDSLGRLYLNIIWSKTIEVNKIGGKDLTFVCPLNPAMAEIKEGEFVMILLRFDNETDRNDAHEKLMKERS